MSLSQVNGMTDVEMLVELQAIYRLKAIRDHAVDQKDWATYAELHTDDYVAMSISSEPIIGGKAPAAPPMTMFCGVVRLSHMV